MNLDALPTAGRLSYCQQNWAQITDSPWLLEAISAGYKLELEAKPRQPYPPVFRAPAIAVSNQVEAEVGKLRQKAAIQEVDPCRGQFVSRLFTVPKKGGACRPVVNLKPLNQFVARKHFKMENASMIRDLLREGDWMTSLDLKDAFLSVPIHADHRKYLRFQWQKELYEFTCLPFGLTSAPRVFTKLMKAVMAVLRRRGIRCMIFIDDLLFLSASRLELIEITKEAMILLKHIGFLINLEKSQIMPQQRIVFLGFILNSIKMTMSLPEEKLAKVVEESSRAMQQTHLSVRALARMIGRMSATTQAILPAPLFYRGLQNLKNMAFRKTQSYDSMVELTQEARQDMVWWTKEVRKWNGRPIRVHPPDLTIDSDASLLGWGAAARSVATGGLWTPSERELHINVLEMMAGSFAVKTFAKDRCNLHVRLRMDNTAAVAYTNHMGGTQSATLAQHAIHLWKWCLKQGISISAEYLPGKENTEADFQSRAIRSSAEWKLDPSAFHRITQRLGPCSVDLFATRINAQLSKYISWKPEPFAMATDALRVTWKGLQGYAFPPFSLIGRCLQKLEREGSEIVLIAPLWPQQLWYPLLMEALTEVPILLPACNHLLTDPFGQLHPLILNQSLQLAAWKVSGQDSPRQAFRTRLLSSSQQDGVKAPMSHINQLGPSGSVGVSRGIPIPLQPL